MSQHQGHEACVYIGPAALCPKPEDERSFLLITGDQGDWVQPVIQERLNQIPENRRFELRHNTIGKPGTTKTWHTFNHPSLNGINDEQTLKWCNPAWDIQHLGCEETENKKLQDILSETQIVENKFHLVIAQGDPHLTLKRSAKLLKDCLSIDLSLHPLALVWKSSVHDYLTEHGYKCGASSDLAWQKEDSAIPVKALATPSESEHFIHPTVQFILNSTNLERYRTAGMSGSDLSLLQQITLGKIDHYPQESIKGLIYTKTKKYIRKLLNTTPHNNQINQQRTEKQGLAIKGEQFNQPETSEISSDEKAPKNQQLRGHIDGFEGGLTLRGWVDASDFGEGTSTLTAIWDERDQVIGEVDALLDRPDLAEAGIPKGIGFAIEVKALRDFALTELLDEPLSIRIVESKSQQPISLLPWMVDVEDAKHALGIVFSDELTRSRKEQIFDYLKTSTNSKYLLEIRKRILRVTATQCITNNWKELPTLDVIKAYDINSALNHGNDQESATRLETILLAWIQLINTLDTDAINNVDKFKAPISSNIAWWNPESLASRIKELAYVGLQAWEKKLFDEYLRPLFDVLIGTLFLQSHKQRLDNSIQDLFNAIASILIDVYGAPQLSFHIRSILKAQKEYIFDEAFTALAHQRGDRFNFLLSHYANQLGQPATSQGLLYYAAAIDFATCSPALHRHITSKLQETLAEHLNQHPRQSKPRHWVERLGTITSNSAQMLVSRMLNLGFARNSIVALHQDMIEIKKDLAHLLWNHSSIHASSNHSKFSQKFVERRKWLIVGEKALTQCWMYRVEQKKTYLENLGCEVRCIDQEELRYWSFSHDILWADAVIFCRLPAMYPYLRAISFAKACGKRTYAEIDDLLFTSEYPADFESYGGSISIEQYKNLCIDYPLRLGMLNEVDEVIVSTQVLADTCRTSLDSTSKPIHIIPNLPLAELECAASSLLHEQEWTKEDNKLKIALTSGTLSHKQVLKDFIYPILLETLEEYPEIELIIVGHIQLPSSFTKFNSRINSVPFSSYSSYLNLLKQASIALVPLEVHPTTDAKSAIKWMEASMCGVASICSPVKAYTDVTTDQEDVLIASKLDEWRTCLKTLIDQSEFRQSLAKQAYKSARQQFNQSEGEKIWNKLINTDHSKPKQVTKKVLVINVFFAPQSVGGATRVAQDYVKDMLMDQQTNYDVTVLCTDYDRWQSDNGKKRVNQSKIKGSDDINSSMHHENNKSLYGTSPEEIVQLHTDLNEQDDSYRESITIDHSNWHGARVIRLNLPAKPWKMHEDQDIEKFCKNFFKDEQFDFIQCHCCQIITASPLIAAQKLGIPYEVIMHDAWWMSEEQFLVSPAGRLINPSDPLDYFDDEPSEEERSDALNRRNSLYAILAGAKRRVAVSSAFQKVCESAGIKDVVVQENQFTSMAETTQQRRKEKKSDALIKLCHIGGMSLHKGYQLFRRAIHKIPPGLNLQFTVVDHRLATLTDQYSSTWNGYRVQFIAPVPMDEMSQFYASHDVLVAPSIWPESFGLVTREALSAGLWVIASNSGALAEPLLTSEPPQGTVIRPNNLEDLVEAITQCPQHLQDQANS